MKKLSWLIMLLVLWGLLLMACRQPSQLTSTPELKTPAIKVATPVPKAGWEQKWETVLSEAKKEGRVSIYTIWGPDIRVAFTEAFRAKYGIDLEFTLFSKAGEVPVRFKAEKSAGLSIASIFASGVTTLLIVMRPEGLLTPIEPLLILPEVLDPKAWYGGKIPFKDKEGLTLGFIGQVQPMVVYNTNLIKEGEITSVKDVLRPQYKGKITLNDPSVTGGGSNSLAHIAINLWSKEEAAEFLRRLVRDQGVELIRDKRLLVEPVARGKYAMCLFAPADTPRDFIAAGAPIKIAITKESNYMTCGSAGFGVPKGFAHPNATIVFLNWLLTKEGQTLFVESARGASLRLDVSTKGIEPALIPVPGEKYYSDSEEHINANEWVLEIAKKIIEEAAR